MDTPVAIYLYADDPVSMAGLGTQLRAQPEVQLVDRQAIDADTVGVVASDVVDESTMSVLRDLNKEGCRRVVLVVTTLDDGMLFPLIDAGVCAVVRRVDATAGPTGPTGRASRRGRGRVAGRHSGPVAQAGLSTPAQCAGATGTELVRSVHSGNQRTPTGGRRIGHPPDRS